MAKFESLSSKEAKELEEEAVEHYKEKVPKKIRQTYQEPDIIHKVKSMFPFQLFPDELLIKKDKITLVNNVGPGMRRMRDLHLHDIAQVEADVGPLFGHLHVIPKLRTEEPLLIDRISRKEALQTRKIIEDLIESHQGIESTY
ncbi:MAG: hypothetical protein WD231_04735 [Candidatus Woykebacteria bacterium]